MNKRGDTLVLEQYVFIVLNIIFAGLMFAFVLRSASGAAVYEQAYSKQIALLVDGAKANTTMILNMEKGLEIAKKNGKLDNVVKINLESGEVIVGLDKKGGYSYKFFSKLNVSVKMDDNILSIIIK